MDKWTLGLLIAVFGIGGVLVLPAASRGVRESARSTVLPAPPPQPEARIAPSADEPPALPAPVTPVEEPRDQSNSKGPRLGDPGPDVVIIDQLANHYGPVVFDHALHVGMCNFGGSCTNCHHEATDGREIASCKTCHGVNDPEHLDRPGLKGAYHRQCLGCHRDWAAENACGFCHEEASGSVDRSKPVIDRRAFASAQHLRVKPTFTYMTSQRGTPVVSFHHADHTDLFGVSCIDCHNGASCNECHGPAPKVPAADREAQCLKCHAEERCTFCHSIEPRGRFEHTRSTGWSLGANHQDLKCAKCHGETTKFSNPPSDNCRACHRGGPSRSFDHSITGVPVLGSHAFFDCVQCHHSGGGETTASCEKCHADRSYPECVPGLPSLSSRLIGLWMPVERESGQRAEKPDGEDPD